MITTHDESGDDTTSSLGDSSYDFIDDRSNVTTDDEDQDALTESTTSSDGQAFEQVHAPLQLQHDENSYGQETANSHDRHGSSGEDHVLPSESPGQTVPGLESHRDHEPIEFDEPSVTNLNSSRFTEVSHTLKIIEKQPRLHEFDHNLLDRLQGHLAVTVRQTMTSRSLVLKNGQYRIMYVGDPASRDPIVQKIGTALAATLKSSTPDVETPRSSKFNIVPISAFGEESSPDVVLIDSSGLELTVEDCTYASFARKECGNDSLKLVLSGGKTVHSSWNGSKFVVSDTWRLPDLAIFCLPDNDSLGLKMTRQFARSFMSRHKVLSIVISQSSTWDKPPAEPITLDYLTPHICLEPQNSSIAHAQIIRRYPVDLATFLNIDAGQMNRNLACLAAASGSSKVGQDHKASTKKPKGLPIGNPWSIREIVELLIADVQKDGLRGLNKYEYIAGFAVVLMSLLGILVVGLGISELLGASRVSTSRVFPVNTSVPSITSVSTSTSTSPTVPLSLSGAFTPIASAPSSTKAQIPPTKSLSTNTDLASFLLDTYTLAPNKSEQFKVHVLGDCHIVLRPPHWFSKMRKSPRLLFKILRGDSELKHQTTTLFDGVYALQVPREDAYGTLSVEVWTESKPIVNENFEVDFGSSWLKAAGWKKATRVLEESVRGDLYSVQTSLSTVYDHTKTGLSTFVQQQSKKVAVLRSSNGVSFKSPLKVATRTKGLIVAQTKDLQRTFSKRVSRVAASSQISRRADAFTKDLTLYTRNKTWVVWHRARVLARAATGVDVKSLVSRAGDFRRSHLRETQKKALKTWWSLRGAPPQKKMKARAKSRSPLGCEL